MTPLLIRGPVGLGDTIYLRAVVRQLTDRHDVYVETVWPQLFEGLPIKCVRRATRLRTQEKNATRPDLQWSTPPHGIPQQRVHYVGTTGTMLAGMYAALGVQPTQITFDLPTFAPWPGKRPYVVIRPATLRKEWPASARNPDPAHLALAAERLRKHFRIISVADLVPGVEWPVGDLPYADERFHAGELTVEQLMALIQGAAGVVGGVGFIVPAAVAYRTPLFLIYGGGINDRRERIFDPRMPTGKVHHAIADNYCLCSDRGHNCRKEIPDIAQQIDEWTMGLVARAAAPMAA